MPAQPEGQREQAIATNEPHQHRQVAESFGSDAERYDRARPSYPGALVGAAKAAQALRPCGRLAVFWNVFQPPPDVGEAFAAIYRQVMPDSPGDFWAKPMLEVYSPMFTKAADGIGEASAFGGPEQWRFDWDRSYTRDEWLEQVPTFGGASQLPPAKLQEILAGIGSAIDATGGSFMMHYTTVAVTAARTSARPAAVAGRPPDE